MAYEPTLISSGLYSRTQLNEEFAKIAAELSELLSRNRGDDDNRMNQDLDMGSHRVLNLPEPIYPTDVVRVRDITEGPILQMIIEALKSRGYNLD